MEYDYLEDAIHQFDHSQENISDADYKHDLLMAAIASALIGIGQELRKLNQSKPKDEQLK
jgi:hypothetical protein